MEYLINNEVLFNTIKNLVNNRNYTEDENILSSIKEKNSDYASDRDAGLT